MNFGVPKKRNVKVEKYPNNAVITLPGVEESGKSRRLEFNKEAAKLLGFDEDEYNYVAFSFDVTDFNNNKIINATNFDSGANLKVTKSNNVSNKKHYNEIKKRFGVDTSEDLELEIKWNGDMYQTTKVFDIVLFENQVEEKEESTEIVNEVIS